MISRLALRLSFLLALLLALLPLPAASGDSLWSRGAGRDGPRSLYDVERLPERKFKPNDLILILVEENGFASNNSNINLRRQFDLQAELRKFAHFDPVDFTLRDSGSSRLPAIDLQSQKRQEGRGTTDRREKILFRIAARVVEVLANGNLIIEAKKTHMINDEESILTLFGEVAADDVSPETRSVRSERIADMKLVYSGRGPVSRNLGRTILSWLMEWLWPF
jgi:flagellar basal body L-ring protein FlgH